MKYKAISLHQPWASLVALGLKNYETRSWGTSYRGNLLICSAKKKYNPDSLIHHPTNGNVRFSDLTNEICELSGLNIFDRKTLDLFGGKFLPLGKVLAVVELTNCHRMMPNNGDVDDIIINGSRPGLKEWLCGDWQVGRSAWELSSVKSLPTPIPIVGKQGLFNPGNEIIQEVERQLSTIS